uniref:RRM domain-containing protein n=1 Tax=Caenorhabditis japonica TaxID=281687 RepID=A0A8R1E5I0_CAEJA
MQKNSRKSIFRETEKTDTPKPVEPPVEQQVDKESAKPAIQKEDDSDELDYEDDEEPKEAAKEEVEEKTEQKKEKKPEKDDDDVARTSVEKEEKVRGTVTHRRASSPSSRHPLSNIVHIRGLTRPFTERALRSVIEKHGGEIADFWIDKVKSHCFAKLNSESNAENVLKELNDTIWPDGNPKKLAIVFDTEENMTRYKDGLGEVKLPEAVTIGTLTGASRASRLSSSTSQTSVLGGKTNFQITLQNAVRDNDKLDLERKEKRGSLASRLTRLDDKEIEKQKEKAKEKEKEKEKPKEEKEEKKRRRSETPPFSRGAGFMNEKKLRKDEPDEKRGRRSDSRRDDSRRDERRRADRSEERVEDPEPPKKSMEEIFRKTAAIPPIYYLPLTDEQVRFAAR